LKFVHVYMTHLGATEVALGMENLKRLFPEVSRIVCHGGASQDFLAVSHDFKIYLEDPTVRDWKVRMRRGDPYLVFEGLAEKVDSLIEKNFPDATHVHFSEYDHLITDPDYFELLSIPWKNKELGILGKSCRGTLSTNWLHSLHYADNEVLLSFLRNISARATRAPEIMGMLGNAFTLRRDALRAIARQENKPLVTYEILYPSLLYHLGFEVGDMADYQDTYEFVRWGPEWSRREMESIVGRASCCHPCKDLRTHGEYIRLAQRLPKA
jgi:hypothetical protein